ncbi:putative ribonuclease H-like domain-containing protein [Tanacetum coccineum]
MDLETAQTNTTAKLPLLKHGEYDMWKLRIEQYFQVQDYALWDVIENGNSFKPAAQTTTNADGSSTTLIPGPVTADEKTQKKNDVKARSMLLMALPNEHLLTFNQYKDAKTLFAAIQTRFGGNDATKKTQKTLLKQMYENFSAPSTESLDSIFNRLQKIVSQLAILGENISQEDLNLKFLRSLPSEWNTHVVVWRNKPDLDTMSFDDLYNNFKIVEQEVKGTASSSSSSQNLAFMSSTSSTNEVNTAYGVSTANTQASTASTQVSTANLSDDTVYAFLASQPNGSQLVHEDLEQIHEDDLEEMDLKWQLALLSMRTRKGPRNQDNRSKNQDNSRRTINVEEISSKAMLAINGAGFDWSFMADEEVPSDMPLMDFSDYELEKLKQDKESNQLKIENFDNAFKSLDKLIGSQIPDKSRKGLGFMSYNVVPPPPAGLFSHLNIDWSNSGLEEFHQPEFEGYRSKISKSVSKDISNEVMKSPNALLVEELVTNDKLEKKTIFPIVAKINFIKPQQQENPVRKPVKYAEMYRSQTPRGNQRNWNNQKSQQLKSDFVMYNKACFVYGSFDHMPKAANTARPNTAVVNAVKANQGHPQIEDQGYVDSGCSRHMTGNVSYLSNFKAFNGGYVTFRIAKGGRITGKGTLKTSKLDFEDVYFVRELQFNLFSVSQMCDKKNNVLFTDTGCFVLSPDFKLTDESQVLLKVPRKNNMYSVDIKNIVPKESLTCLVAKVTLDESMLWHRRLGHINFKNINKLVKDNLARGLPSKHFKNDQTCVACLKGKQHKASCKSKIQNSISQPLFMLHMDLFGPTFVSSLMNKKYCLVVTDDYSRFTWVFFLASKDETSDILKSFITQIENLVDKKVKIIRCDNGTEFKNRVMSEFCEKKGIKREFSVARTPQQNGVAKRRNRTLIQATRTMVLVVKPHNKTPYELFRGRTPSLSFMRPFGCHVTILNTLDHLGKFDGKSDDGFFVGYSLNSKAFRVYNIRTRKVEENLHVRFLEDKPIIAGDGPKWLFDIDVLTKSMNYVSVVAGTNSNDFVGTKESVGTDHSSEETGSSQDYILMPLWKDGSLFDSSSKNARNDLERMMMKVELMIKKGLKIELKMLILLSQVLILPVQILILVV